MTEKRHVTYEDLALLNQKLRLEIDFLKVEIKTEIETLKEEIVKLMREYRG